ncbi:uncharacterized protein si:dkey-192k22.2 isoform X2 [Cyclopterus lumpus]|uniref:uncharacterized protein si:dkey-192k22.2 isoform X2 n=1 Tax=Cyclopterus lumpus TaxID=8103 RepID=UPI0014865720|nr:uncharacterized protein si:dkey-192k22.2 isoform X2 [Cyclopterus lumpus]
MTRVALTKLLILVILAFIICLPEFFPLYTVSKVNFLCLPYRPCGRGIRQRKGANGKSGDAEIGRRDLCDPPRTPGSNKWEQDCTRENQSNVTDPESHSGGAGQDPEENWFMCVADMDMAELQRNMSSSALKTHLEVSVELQLSDAETLNLTLYSGSNHSSLHFHPPGEEEEEEEEEEDGGDDEGQRRAFYCCLPVPLAAESANPRHCLLWLANRTVWSATAQEKLPWKRSQQDEWRCVLRALWLALLCVVMLTAVTTVLGLIYWKRRSCKNPDVLPLGYAVAGQQLNDGEKHTEIIIPKGTTFHSHGPRPRPGLSPIQEVDTQANLHHRIHPSTSSLTEEQTC